MNSIQDIKSELKDSQGYTKKTFLKKKKKEKRKEKRTLSTKWALTQE